MATNLQSSPDVNSAPRAPRWRAWGGNFLRLFICATILAWVFHGIFKKEKPEVFWSILTSIQPLWLLAALGLAGLNCLVGTIRWHAILEVQDLHLGWKRTAGIFFIGAFFNTFMVGVTGGDVTKAYYAAKETHHKQTEAMMTVVVDRLVGMLGMLAVTVFLLVLNAHYLLYESSPALRLAALIVMAFMFSFICAIALGFWQSPLHWVFEKLPSRIGDQLKRASDAYRVYAQHPKIVIKTFLLSVAVHLISTLVTISLAHGIAGATVVPVGKYFLICPLINCLAAIPVTPGGLGMREGLYSTLFGPLGLEASKAVSLSLIFFAVSLVWNLLGGVVFLLWRERKSSPRTS